MTIFLLSYDKKFIIIYDWNITEVQSTKYYALAWNLYSENNEKLSKLSSFTAYWSLIIVNNNTTYFKILIFYFSLLCFCKLLLRERKNAKK